MCNGNTIHSGSWTALAESAAEGHRTIPLAPGAYVVRVRSVGQTDLLRVRQAYERSDFMKALRVGDIESEKMLGSFGFGAGWGWQTHAIATKRLARIDGITAHLGDNGCQVVYIGKANDLRRRMKELTCWGHTVNHALWALLHAGWTFDIALIRTVVGGEGALEADLKRRYAALHASVLPALVVR